MPPEHNDPILNAAGASTIAVRGRWPSLRVPVILLAGAETVVLLLFIAVVAPSALSSDPLGRAIGRGVIVLTAMPLVLFALPALAMGVMNRWLPLALVLVLLAVATGVVLYFYA